jgi:hypothetical protein
MFKADATLSAAPVTSMTFTLPPGATAPAKVFVTGLVPGAPYTLTNAGGEGAYVVSQGGSNLADSSGVALF